MNHNIHLSPLSSSPLHRSALSCFSMLIILLLALLLFGCTYVTDPDEQDRDFKETMQYDMDRQEYFINHPAPPDD